MGTGIFFATVLVFGAATLAAYSYFRLSRRAAGFQHFEVRETWEHGGGGDPLRSPAPDWLLHRAHRESGAQKLAHLGGFRRQAPALIGGAFKADGFWGGGQGQGPAWSGLPLQPASKLPDLNC